MKILTAITAFTMLYYIESSITNDKPQDHRHLLTSLLNNKWTSAGRRPMTLSVKASEIHSMLILILTLAGDIELNPEPRTKQHNIYPCGLCEHSVTWNCEGICCEDCSVWHHRSCIELCSADYDLLQRPNVQWLCCKCEIINVPQL